MSVSGFLHQTVGLWRLQAVGGTSKKALTQVATIKVLITPMSATAAQTSQLTFAQAYTGYALQVAGVETGDVLIDANGLKYNVQGLRPYFYGTQPFVELVLQKQALQGNAQ